MVELINYVENGEKSPPKLGSKEAIELMNFLSKHNKSIICKDNNLNLRGAKIINNKNISGYAHGNSDKEAQPLSSITKAPIIRDAIENNMLVPQIIDGKDNKKLLLEVADGIKGFIKRYNGNLPSTPFPIMPDLFPNLEIWKVIDSPAQFKELNELKFKMFYSNMEGSIKADIIEEDIQSNKIVFKDKYFTRNIVNYLIESGISIKQNRLLFRDNQTGCIFMLGVLESSKGFTIYGFHDYQKRVVYQMFNEELPNQKHNISTKSNNTDSENKNTSKEKESNPESSNKFEPSTNPKDFYVNQDILNAFTTLNKDLKAIQNVIESKFIEGNKRIKENLVKYNYYNAEEKFNEIVNITIEQLNKSFVKGLNIDETLKYVQKRILDRIEIIQNQTGAYILNPNKENTNQCLKLIKASKFDQKNYIYILNTIKKYFLLVKEFKAKYQKDSHDTFKTKQVEINKLYDLILNLDKLTKDFFRLLEENISKQSIEIGYGKFLANAQQEVKNSHDVYLRAVRAESEKNDDLLEHSNEIPLTIQSVEKEIKQVNAYYQILKSKYNKKANNKNDGTVTNKGNNKNDDSSENKEDNETKEIRKIKNLLKVDTSGKSPYKKPISTLKVPYGASESEMVKSILSFYRRNLKEEATKLTYDDIVTMYKDYHNELTPEDSIIKIEPVEPSESLLFTKKVYFPQFFKGDTNIEESKNDFFVFNIITSKRKDKKVQIIISKNTILKNSVCGYSYGLQDSETKIGSTRFNNALNILLSYKIRLSLKEYGLPIKRVITTLSRLGTDPIKNCYYAISEYLEEGKGAEALIHSVEDEIFVSSAYEEREATKSSVATVFDTKKNINKDTQSLMDNSKFLGRIFNYVEYDDDVKKEDVIELEKRFLDLEPSLPQLKEKLELRVRKLGRHRFNGAYRHSDLNKTICINVRDISSFVHEYGHAIDYNYTSNDKNLSLSPDFEYILRTYNRSLVDKKLGDVSYAGYFRTPTEVFARSYELYFHSKYGAIDLSHSEEHFEDEQYQVITRDKDLYNKVLDYFNNL